MTSTAFTIAILMYLVPGEGVSVHAHMVSVGQATREQREAAIAEIRTEFPEVIPLRAECQVKEIADDPDVVLAPSRGA